MFTSVQGIAAVVRSVETRMPQGKRWLHTRVFHLRYYGDAGSTPGSIRVQAV